MSYNPAAGGAGGATSLSGLTDTNISGPTIGQRLSYDVTSSKWQNANSVSTIGDLGDVTTAGVAVGKVLEFTGAAWAPATAGGGNFILQEKKVIASATQTLNFASLDGNSNIAYVFFVQVAETIASSVNYSWTPNNIVASGGNQSSERIAAFGGSITGATAAINYMAGIPATNGNGCCIFMVIHSNAATIRAYHCLSIEKRNTNSPQWRNYGGMWDDASSNLTSIQLTSNSSVGYGTGTIAACYKVTS